MKKLTVIVAMLSLATLSFGQRLMLGETQLNAGLGFNSGDWELPIYFGFDYGVHPDITVGGMLSYATSDIKYNGKDDDGTWFGLAARGDYHFNTILQIPNNWDVYAGLTLAYNNFSYDNEYDGYDYDDSGLGLRIQAGGRYYFQENLAINLEFGGSNIATGGRIGITYRF